MIHDRAHQRVRFLRAPKLDGGDRRDDVEDADDIVDEHRRERDDAVQPDGARFSGLDGEVPVLRFGAEKENQSDYR